MQEPRTVLVLGAGASAPYGFMLGDALKVKVAVRLHETQQMIRPGYSATDLHDFRNAISRNMLVTMDEFLDEHPRYRRVGARLMAEVIGVCEQEDNLFKQPLDWYTGLFKELRLREKEGPDLSHLSIVTFNYERSLEHFMEDSIKHNCPENVQPQAREMWSKVRIVHAHGCLGKYPDVPYGVATGDHKFEAACQGLMIATDKMDNAPVFKEAQQLVVLADRIVFIGFGYSKHTLDSLLPNTLQKEREIYGTCYQMPQDRISTVMSYFNNKMVFAAPTINAKSFMDALSNGPSNGTLFSGLFDMSMAKLGSATSQATAARSSP